MEVYLVIKCMYKVCNKTTKVHMYTCLPPYSYSHTHTLSYRVDTLFKQCHISLQVPCDERYSLDLIGQFFLLQWLGCHGYRGELI